MYWEWECNVHHALRAHNTMMEWMTLPWRGAKEPVGRDVCMHRQLFHMVCVWSVAHIRQRQFRTVLNLPSTWSTLVYIWENAKRAKLQNETKWNETYNTTLTMVQIHRKKSLFHHERWDETECTAIKPMRMVFVYIYVSGYRKHWTVAKQPQRSTFSECESIQD